MFLNAHDLADQLDNQQRNMPNLAGGLAQGAQGAQAAPPPLPDDGLEVNLALDELLGLRGQYIPALSSLQSALSLNLFIASFIP